jgi:hypothetical protein
VFGIGVFEVTAEPVGISGLDTFQEKFILQLLAPSGIEQVGETGVRVPDIPPPPEDMHLEVEESHIVPDAQLALIGAWAKITPLL